MSGVELVTEAELNEVEILAARNISDGCAPATTVCELDGRRAMLLGRKMAAHLRALMTAGKQFDGALMACMNGGEGGSVAEVGEALALLRALSGVEVKP